MLAFLRLAQTKNGELFLSTTTTISNTVSKKKNQRDIDRRGGGEAQQFSLPGLLIM
jgi:hypothetical protein